VGADRGRRGSGLGLGIGFRVSASGIADEVQTPSRCRRAGRLDQLTTLEDRGTLHTRLGVGLIAIGGVALTVGIVRAVLQRKASPREDERVVNVTPIPRRSGDHRDLGMR